MGSVRWDEGALRRAVAAAARPKVRELARSVEGRANAMSAGYRTGRYHRDHMSPAVGDTQPQYAANVEDFNGWPVGIVYTGNYAAMKDNHENNTLLKARG